MRPAPAARLASAPLAALLLAGLAPAVAAQGGPVFLASTTNPVSGPPAFDDSTVLRLRAGDPARAQFDAGHWKGVCDFVPGDIDALGRRPGVPSGDHRSLAFSLLSNEGNYLDGDVLGFAFGGGLEVLLPEDQIAAALGLSGANIDLDALDFDDTGALLFSLTSDWDGTALGPVANGDVLRLTGVTVTRIATEADVQAALLAATGLTGAVGDVHGVTWWQGEAWVVVQGPSEVDGGALSLGATPVLALDESAAGLGGEELDALVAIDAPADLGVLTLEPQLFVDGAPIDLRFRGAGPGDPLLLLWAGNAGYTPIGLPGFGAWYLAPDDAWLAAAVSSGALPLFFADAEGELDLSLNAPPNLGGLGWDGSSGWSFQVLNLASLEVTAPFRAEY